MHINSVNQGNNLPQNNKNIKKEDDNNQKLIFQYDNDKSGIIDEQEALEYIKDKTGQQNISDKYLKLLKNFKIDLNQNIENTQKSAIINKLNNIVKTIINEKTNNNTKNKQLLDENYNKSPQEIQPNKKLQNEIKNIVNLQLQSEAKKAGIDVDKIVETVVASYKGEPTNDESINVAIKEIIASKVESEIVKALENVQKTD